MKDDLISRSALLKAMDGRYKEKAGIVLDNLAEGFMQMEKLIKEQPTAYDVEKVVAELEEVKLEYETIYKRLEKEAQSQAIFYLGFGSGCKASIEIVRNAGKE